SPPPPPPWGGAVPKPGLSGPPPSVPKSPAAKPRSRQPKGQSARPPELLQAVAGICRPRLFVFLRIKQSRSDRRMAGNLTFDQLKKAVAAGDIDTVIACAVDMQGRLVGKRFLGRYFVDSPYD